MESIDLSDKIQRSPELERRFGVTIEGLFAHLARDTEPSSLDSTMTINGEIRAVQPEGLHATLRLFTSAHDALGRTLGVWTTEVARDGFAVCQAFSIHEYCNALPRIEIAAVKIYPQGL